MDKKYIIIALIVIFLLLVLGIGYLMFSDNTTYVTVNIVKNGTSMEIPSDMKIKSNNSDSGITVLENDNTIVILFNSADKNIAQIVGFAEIKNPIFGSEMQGNVSINNPTIAGCSLKGECNAVFIGNDETHDNIIVISQKSSIVNHIINSIKWNSNSVSTHENNDTSDSSDTKQTVYAYKSDGTPMYSQSEVDNYMEEKYGLVDYHIKGNGYIDLDEPGYDDAGNYIEE